MSQLSKAGMRRAEDDAIAITRALVMLFGHDRVFSCAFVESITTQESAVPLGLAIGSLVRSEFKTVVMKTLAEE